MGTKYKGTQKEIRALNAFINFMRAADSVSSRLSRLLAKYELTMSQFAALEALYHLGPLNQNELGKKLLKTSGNITMVVDNLEKRVLVKRVRISEDRRSVSVTLTEDGRRFIKSIFPQHVGSIVADFEVLSAREQEVLRHLCRKLGKQERD
ncbi:MAG: MarR family transcriptional regulator [Thermodesulfobacteriota bacterium]